MSYVIVAPETMAATATDLTGIGSALSEAHMAAAPSTVGLVPAAADEVSAGVAHVFSRYAEDFQGLAGRAAVFHEQFVGHLIAGAGSYARAEAANASSLLHPLAASAGSIGGAIGTFWDQLVSSFNTAVGQLSNLLTRFWTGLSEILLDLAYITLYIIVITIYYIYCLLTGTPFSPYW
jgi:hypothetical protein